MANIISKPKNSISSRHGHIFSPKSRAFFAWEKGQIDDGMLNQREAGKFFPAKVSGLADPVAPTDVHSALPPRDGEIASANQGNARFLDQPGSDWPKHDVISGQLLPVRWYYSAVHVTRRWNYFITRKDWNPDLPLSRAQFDEKPFFSVELTEQPFWSHGDALTPPNPTEHTVMLPERRSYHVLLAVWEVANTGNAFYQVIDLNFTDSTIPLPPPAAPEALRVKGMTCDTISLAWSAPSVAAAYYNIYRDGLLADSVKAVEFTDSGLKEDTEYTYEVTSVAVSGAESARSHTLTVRTQSCAAIDNPPTAPGNLHSMKVTTNSVSLMWSPSQSSVAIKRYILHRDGHVIAHTPACQLTYVDSPLQEDTTYHYYVVAQDANGLLSAPGNQLAVTTEQTSTAPDPDPYRKWALRSTFSAGEIVSHNGRLWQCLQTHVAYSPEWAPGASDSATLWRQVKP
ncbi:MAG: GlcNAc-binding protein A [Pantoea stewartii]|uniref:lytic polysaccharide monooxygenase n=1 Tax=Pantoea stewartii TaxID=66269 RepID=UPI0006CF7591|nr:lytic polysaccharide monooxygenase [Pantoea stewartii]WHS98745.1 MAG: GlcNAc-binding protein A [Pantoea stewartii]